MPVEKYFVNSQCKILSITHSTYYASKSTEIDINCQESRPNFNTVIASSKSVILNINLFEMLLFKTRILANYLFVV